MLFFKCSMNNKSASSTMRQTLAIRPVASRSWALAPIELLSLNGYFSFLITWQRKLLYSFAIKLGIERHYSSIDRCFILPSLVFGNARGEITDVTS
jgi:hypothetical protein